MKIIWTWNHVTKPPDPEKNHMTFAVNYKNRLVSQIMWLESRGLGHVTSRVFPFWETVNFYKRKVWQLLDLETEAFLKKKD